LPPPVHVNFTREKLIIKLLAEGSPSLQ